MKPGAGGAVAWDDVHAAVDEPVRPTAGVSTLYLPLIKPGACRRAYEHEADGGRVVTRDTFQCTCTAPNSITHTCSTGERKLVVVT